MTRLTYLFAFLLSTSAFAGGFGSISTGQIGSINYGGVGGINMAGGMRSGSVGGITLSPGSSGPAMNFNPQLNPSSDQQLNDQYRRMREEDANRSSELAKKAEDPEKMTAERLAKEKAKAEQEALQAKLAEQKLRADALYKETLPHATKWESFDQRGGRCVEVDEATMGEKFKLNISINRCRPKETTYAWNEVVNHCLEVDPDTMGFKFVSWVEGSYCRPEKIKYDWADRGCYEKDASGASSYSFKTDDIKCAPAQVSCKDLKINFSPVWVLVDSKTGGKAYESQEAGAQLCEKSGTFNVNRKLSQLGVIEPQEKDIAQNSMGTKSFWSRFGSYLRKSESGDAADAR